MTARSIDIVYERTEEIRRLALDAGFSRARFLTPFQPLSAAAPLVPRGYEEGAPALLVVALPYGNDDPDVREEPSRPTATAPAEGPQPGGGARIAPFARRNYYAEAVARLKAVAVELRKRHGGARSDYRILCNSPIPEKPLAAACGLGSVGRNTLVITPEAGSLVILAAMTLPFPILADGPEARRSTENGTDQAGNFTVCGNCSACVAACPTHALDGGALDRTRCIAWFASGHGEPPPEVEAAWENRLYGCTVCQDVCPHNRRPIRGVATDRGALPAEMDAAELIAMTDDDLRAKFRGTAMGMAWLGPEAIRKNALSASLHLTARYRNSPSLYP